MRFYLSAELLNQLRVRREGRRRDPIQEEHDAFLLDPGLGPASYVTADGRVLIDDASFWGERGVYEASDEEALRVIVAGARKGGIADLLSLLPARPTTALDCPDCGGTRWWNVVNVVCPKCNGLGWKQ